MNTILQDLRFGLRMLLRTPGFALVVVAVLAVGIGATSAIFSVVNAILLRPLPYHDSERVYQVDEVNPKGDPSGMPFADMQAIAGHASAVERAAFSHWENGTLVGPEGAENIFGAKVTRELFPLLGVGPRLGRGFRDDEFQPDAPGVVILSYRLWDRRFGLDPRVLGRELMLNGRSHTIIGVMSSDFFFRQRFEYWVPWKPTAEETGTRENRYASVVRLRPGATGRQLMAEADGVLRNLAPEDFRRGWRIRATSIEEQIKSRSRTALLTLLGAVGFVLLIACINVANLLLARGADRSREMAIRAALGAGRARAFRQLLTESMLVAIAGGALGLLLGWLGAKALVGMFPERNPIPRLDQTHIDGSVLVFTFAVSVFTGVLFGIIPAFQATRGSVIEALKTGTRGSSGGRRIAWVRNGLIVVETALSVVLLAGAGLMLRSFSRILSVETGFRPEHVLTLRVPLPTAIKERPQQIDYYNRLLEHIRRLPGLNAAGLFAPLPLSGVDANSTFAAEGRPVANGERQLVKIRTATPGSFPAMGLTLLRGRVFNETDTAGSLPVAVVSEALARRHFPNDEAVGRRITMSSEGKGPWMTIVGVVRDTKFLDLTGDAAPEMYRPLTQFIFSPFATALVVRTVGANPESVAASIQKQIRDFNPDQPVNDVLPMREVVSRSAAQPRFYTGILGLFAVVALLLAAAGLYGVLSYTVSQRVREMGIRIALGAPREAILRNVIGRAMLVVWTGMTIGLAGAFALTRLLAAQLYQVKATDPATYFAVCIILSAVAATAAWMPARRAMLVDPVVALRSE